MDKTRCHARLELQTGIFIARATAHLRAPQLCQDPGHAAREVIVLERYPASEANGGAERAFSTIYIQGPAHI